MRVMMNESNNSYLEDPYTSSDPTISNAIKAGIVGIPNAAIRGITDLVGSWGNGVGYKLRDKYNDTEFAKRLDDIREALITESPRPNITRPVADLTTELTPSISLYARVPKIAKEGTVAAYSLGKGLANAVPAYIMSKGNGSEDSLNSISAVSRMFPGLPAKFISFGADVLDNTR